MLGAIGNVYEKGLSEPYISLNALRFSLLNNCIQWAMHRSCAWGVDKLLHCSVNLIAFSKVT